MNIENIVRNVDIKNNRNILKKIMISLYICKDYMIKNNQF